MTLPEIGLRLVLAGCGRGTWFRAARGVGRHEAHEVALAWAAAGLYRPDPTLPLVSLAAPFGVAGCSDRRRLRCARAR